MNETKTIWDLLVSGEALQATYAQRKKTFIEDKVRRTLLPELEEEGWEEEAVDP